MNSAILYSQRILHVVQSISKRNETFERIKNSVENRVNYVAFNAAYISRIYQEV